MSLLGDLRHRLDAPPVDRHVDEVGRRGQVVVPDVVSGDLVVPDPLARADVQADQRVAEQVVAVPVAAVVVVGRRAEGQVHVAQLLVGAHQRPHVGVADGLPRVVLPRLVTDLAGAGHGPEGPEPLAGADVEAAHVADGHGLANGEAQHRGPDHDDVADDHRRRGVTVEPAVRDGPAEALGEIDRALGAEALDGPAGLRVERDHERVTGQHDDPLVGPVAPVGDAAVEPPVVRRHSELVGARVEDPLRLPGRRVDGRDLRQRRARVEHPVDHDGGALVNHAGIDAGVGGAHGVVGRRPAPGDLERGDVRGVDLIERRVLRAGIGAGVRGPLAARERGHRVRRGAGDLLRADPKGQGDEQDGGHGHAAGAPGGESHGPEV